MFLSNFLKRADLFVESPLWDITEGTVIAAGLIALVICTLYYKKR